MRRATLRRCQDVGDADVVLDVIGGEVLQRSTALVGAGGTLVTIAEPPATQPEVGRAAFGPDAPRSSGKTIIQVTEGW